MENLKFDKDVVVMYVDASSFPDGVLAAHQKLHALFPFSIDRRYFGLSRPEHGKIQYKAAAEVLASGEAENLGLPIMVLKAGEYYAITIRDYMKDIPAIQRAFNELIALPGIDTEGYCVEEYINPDDMVCIVRKA